MTTYILLQKVKRAETQDFSIVGVSHNKNVLEVLIDAACVKAEAVHEDKEFIEYFKKSFEIVEAPFFDDKGEI